jgi:tRNA acetyltransferase TAN1
LKAIPLEIITETDYEKIANATEILAPKIEENKTFRISVTNRGSNLSSRTIIEKCAEKINRKVDLKNFDYEVIIEIIGNIAGVSILKREQIFSLHKFREKAIREISGQE